MALVSNVQLALTRVADEVKALKLQDSTLAEAVLQLEEALQSRPVIVVSATPPENPTEGLIWLDTSQV